ncbi:hypothetical protein [Gordonia sp. WA4-43]|uniref:hypothetical protein n=1 Tax=Gordonia sp. WA4-43 TaxID=2878678 RepID=UPI001CFBEB1E|nr:hypothetical protein [Gordonia sp. WA4-43]UCZ92242.1 hypothetical protein LEL84_11690 [Gordonia sp. WA4-43]
METTTAADTLRRWALDEDLKSRVMADPALPTVRGESPTATPREKMSSPRSAPERAPWNADTG